MDPQLRQAITSLRPSFLVAVSAFVTCIAVGFVLLQWHSDLPFDSTTWKNEEDLRPRMIRNLLDNHKLVGQSRDAVHTVLGVPSGVDEIQCGKASMSIGLGRRASSTTCGWKLNLMKVSSRLSTTFQTNWTAPQSYVVPPLGGNSAVNGGSA